MLPNASVNVNINQVLLAVNILDVHVLLVTVTPVLLNEIVAVTSPLVVVAGLYAMDQVTGDLSILLTVAVVLHVSPKVFSNWKVNEPFPVNTRVVDQLLFVTVIQLLLKLIVAVTFWLVKPVVL